MTKLPFLRTMTTLKSLFSRRGTSSAPVEKTLAPTTSGRLRHILPVLAYRQGSEEPVRLLCGRLSTSGMVFRTTNEVKEGESFELEFLLSGYGQMKVMAQVKFVALAGETQTDSPPSMSALGYVKPIHTYSGQLELWTTASQQDAILGYLCRQHDQSRRSAAR
jgi:hypothetical protein